MLQFTDRQKTAQRALADRQFNTALPHPVIEGIKSLIDAGMFTEALAHIEDLFVVACGWTQYRGFFTDGTWTPVTLTRPIKYRRNYMRIPVGTVVLATSRDVYAGLQVWDPFSGNVVAHADVNGVKSR